MEDFIASAGPGLDHQLGDLHVGYATFVIACGGISCRLISLDMINMRFVRVTLPR